MTEQEAKGIGERLKQVRKALGLNQTQMGKHFGINQSTYGQKEKGFSHLTAEMFLKLYQEFNINIHWLLGENGEMFRPAEVIEQTEKLEEPKVEYGLSQRMTDLEKKYDELIKKIEK